MRQACYYVKCVKFCTWVVLGRSGDCQAPYRFGKIAQLRVSTPGWIYLGKGWKWKCRFAYLLALESWTKLLQTCWSLHGNQVLVMFEVVLEQPEGIWSRQKECWAGVSWQALKQSCRHLKSRFPGSYTGKVEDDSGLGKAILGLGINTLIISQHVDLQFMQSLLTSNASTDQAVSCTHVIPILWLHLGSWSDAFYSGAWRSMHHAYLRQSVVCQRLTRKGLLQRLSTFLLCPPQICHHHSEASMRDIQKRHMPRYKDVLEVTEHV